MSQDYQIAFPCPHLTIEEVVELDSGDRRSLDTRQPVGGAGTVQILANGTTPIPSSGLKSFASLYSSQSGPYTLVENEDEITIQTSEGSFTVSLGVKGRIRKSADLIVQSLKASALSNVVLENIGGHLAITDGNQVGTGSFVKVTGSAAAALGFGDPKKNGLQYRAQGKEIYPPWELVVREDEIVNRFPRFKSPVKGNPTFKVTYTVPPNRCLRCRATLIENDMRFTTSGQPLMITNEDLLYQAALKILLTDKGSNPFFTWYGTTIRERIGSKALGSVAAAISDDVRKSLDRLFTLQKDQSDFQQVTPKERLYQILSVNTRPHREDPTTYLVDVVIQNASGDPVELSIVFTVPEVVSLMGSNGLFLGTQAAGITDEQAATQFR